MLLGDPCSFYNQVYYLFIHAELSARAPRTARRMLPGAAHFLQSGPGCTQESRREIRRDGFFVIVSLKTVPAIRALVDQPPRSDKDCGHVDN
jgi:hypothetical protein